MNKEKKIIRNGKMSRTDELNDYFESLVGWRILERLLDALEEGNESED